MSFNELTPVGKVAAEYPLATRVFARHGIDYCCGGGLPLKEACAAVEIPVDQVLDEIQHVLAGTSVGTVRWDREPLPILIGHILATYHGPLREELPRLDGMCRKVLRAHGGRDPEKFQALVDVFDGLRKELESHMQDEEQRLFPLVLQSAGDQAGDAIDELVHEHEAAGEALRTLRRLCDDYVVPEGACNTWRALWHGLAELEKDLHEHIHLENNILFPRALEKAAVQAAGE